MEKMKLTRTGDGCRRKSLVVMTPVAHTGRLERTLVWVALRCRPSPFGEDGLLVLVTDGVRGTDTGRGASLCRRRKGIDWLMPDVASASVSFFTSKWRFL